MSLQTRVDRVIIDLKEIQEDCKMTDQNIAIQKAIQELESASFFEYK